MSNAIQAIYPYRDSGGTWVFDDAAHGLVREPFVAGVPEMIESAIQSIPDAENGFKVLFSANEFPGFTHSLTHRLTHMGGAWYRLDGTEQDGWLCGALTNYFKQPPDKIYISVGAKAN